MKKIKQTKLKTLLALASLCTIGSAFAIPAPTTKTYNNVFMSYITPKNVNQIGNYIKSNNLQGTMLWEISEDLPYTDSGSLIRTISQSSDFTDKVVGLYWANWDMYKNQNAIPGSPQPIKGFQSTFTELAKTNIVYVYYAFLEAISNKDKPSVPSTTGNIGTLYFSDPYSDLSPGTCQDSNLSDSYKLKQQGLTQGREINCSNGTGSNNFTDFKNLSGVKKIMSVGGHGHDATFESIFDGNGGLNETYAHNFVTSAKNIITNNNLDGIDLDYENINMTAHQSESYLLLVQKLRDELGPDKKIILTVLANQDFLSGKDGIGFNNLKNFEPLINSLQLMTYDFHGDFDFAPGGTKKTGFLSNLNNNSTYAPRFSIKASVKAAVALGIPANTIITGTPVYGRSLTNIQAGANGNGLGQPAMIGNVGVIPGTTEQSTCTKDKTCNGIIDYKYIMLHMKNTGFTSKNWDSESATTAYANSWTLPAVEAKEFTIQNTGQLSFHLQIKGSTGLGTQWFPVPSIQGYNPADYGITGSANTITYEDVLTDKTQTCPNDLDVTKNAIVTISIDQDAHGTCSISYP